MSESALKNIKQLQVHFDASCSSGHTLFIKEHSTRSNDFDHPTILVLNVPPYCDEKCLRRIFAGCGKIVTVHEQKNPGKIERKYDTSKYFGSPKIAGFHVAYISFLREKSISNVMKFIDNAKKPILLSTPQNEIYTGLKKMCLDYVDSFPDFKDVQKEIDNYMEVYDAKVAKKERDEKLLDGKPDEDGWVKVTRKGKNPSFTRSEANEVKIRAQLKRKQEKQKNSLSIYSYQVRESKRAKIMELQKKFEDDKKKIEALKQARKFKPV